MLNLQQYCNYRYVKISFQEIIVHINAQNRAQDDSNDPIVQIGKVLNAHMDSLQWVDQSMVQVSVVIRL